ncbi:metal-dependent hydrolase [Stutzerimonas tarimensis]|uniref:Metal-dependent hydrolase n=1 Tax=Stutzerimonas tarimensis TaxID=1507735 RepID=A0ABV7T1W2_9GAMM
MDSLTQAVLGACVQGTLLGRWQGRKALLYGAALATLPDLDVILDYGDAVANMTQHRGFSHALLVLSLVAVLLAWFIRRVRPHPGYSGTRLFLTLWLVLITHVLLDTFTSYGTQLFWPLQSQPVAWSTIFIIDPLYTLPLLLAAILGATFGLRGRLRHWPAMALALSTLYLGFTVAGKQMAESSVAAVLREEGIRPELVFSAPTPFNSLLWRVVIMDEGHYHEAVVGWLDREPPRLVSLPRGAELRPALAESAQHARLQWFSGGALRYDEMEDQLVVTDLRLGMTGFHPFRFPLAERAPDGRWELIDAPERLAANRGNSDRLWQLWARIWNQQPELPLEHWALVLEARH